MTSYFIRRFLLIIPTFLGITVLVFVIMQLVPGGEELLGRLVWSSLSTLLGIVLALSVIALPLLTFVSDICGLIGGAFVAFIYGDMAFQRFVLLLRDAVDMSTLMVGIIKAPFMGLIVGLIAANEGLNVQGSAESLGRHTTSSVVKAIFMVIVADGIFAIFFAAIDY